MANVVALVGRPNVGKSTLFNRLTRSREALVADVPGVTRDRKYGFARHPDGGGFIVVDTGGLADDVDELEAATARQAREAIAEADLVLLLLDARAGLTAGDELIVADLRRQSKAVLAVVNKVDGLDERSATAEFHALGLASPLAVAALPGRGVARLVDAVMERLVGAAQAASPDPPEAADGRIRVCVVGRPNAGKSTLVNRLLGEERMIASELPGTTRDSVEIPFEFAGQAYTLIDTAGVRRRGRVREAVEKFSVIQALAAIESSHVAMLMLDAEAGIAEQDLHLLGYIGGSGRALVIAVNKWDLLGGEQRERVRSELDRRLTFAPHAQVHFVSALHGRGVRALLRSAQAAYQSATRRFAAGDLTTLLEEAMSRHPPPLARGRRIKLRYAHQGGSNPPVIVLHGSQAERIPDSYRRYLGNFFTNALGLKGTPVQLNFRSGDNPFAGRRNELTRRQRLKRRRIMRHHK